jgi:hypothetical protein
MIIPLSYEPVTDEKTFPSALNSEALRAYIIELTLVIQNKLIIMVICTTIIIEVGTYDMNLVAIFIISNKGYI